MSSRTTYAAAVGASGVSLVVSPPLDVLLAQTASEWQSDYDDAASQRSSGKKKMLIGAALAIGGVVVAVAGTESTIDGCIDDIFEGGDCSGTRALQTVGWVASLAGDGVFIWGVVDFWEGSSRMRALEANPNRPRAGAFTIPLGPNQHIALSTGPRTSVAWQMSW